MKPPGPLLASGRDSDIFEYGPGLILRRSRQGRSMAAEARVMEYARQHGYPVPAVDELSGDGRDMIMERIDGLDMVGAIQRRPWQIPALGRSLAGLHRRLHEIPAPDWVPAAPVGAGDSLLHLDLHPLNVMLSATGPVVIDWSGACRGDPSTDVAVAWVLMEAGEVQTGPVLGLIAQRARAVLVRNFLRGVDGPAARRALRQVVAWKVNDPHMSAGEQARMWRVVDEEEQAP
ncbi:MAG TPA: phosphotransferase [Acidimicrobiales bacterium]|nr:phosphotransferase [Acidimicrobiales bacterium]